MRTGKHNIYKSLLIHRAVDKLGPEVKNLIDLNCITKGDTANMAIYKISIIQSMQNRPTPLGFCGARRDCYKL